ncbi:Uncharacterized protein HZ326_11627 [Fusarium oxysporum f. sp. albedinis]|nr:Uncharacterized protein HZ326_11627 [Fusarium oxysporum f. sp. albedinis]
MARRRKNRTSRSIMVAGVKWGSGFTLRDCLPALDTILFAVLWMIPSLYFMRPTKHLHVYFGSVGSSGSFGTGILHTNADKPCRSIIMRSPTAFDKFLGFS